LFGKPTGVLTKLYAYSNNIDIAKFRLKGGHNGNSLLYEVQKKERDKQPQAGHAQEPQTSHTRCLPCVRDKSIQNRKTLNICGSHRVLMGHALAVIRFMLA
jgi:hypothetical protein